MNLLLASNNPHKFEEVTGVCRANDLDVSLFRPADLGFSYHCREEGDTFAANAGAKAWGLHALLRGRALPHVTSSPEPPEIERRVRDHFDGELPWILADDSGVSVAALGGRPGVHSAIYGDAEAGRTLRDEERVERLLSELGHHPDRSAWYTCHALLVVDSERFFSAQLTWEGTVGIEPLPGPTGFGYDPIFLLPEYGTSVARLPQQQKDRISHRARAVSAVIHASAFHQTAGA